VPHAEEPDLRVRLDDLLGPRLADAALLDDVAEVERRRRAAAEADDVDDVIVLLDPVGAERVVGLLQAPELAESERAAEDLPHEVPARAEAGGIEGRRPRFFFVGVAETDDVAVLELRILAGLVVFPRTVEGVERHIVASAVCGTISLSTDPP